MRRVLIPIFFIILCNSFISCKDKTSISVADAELPMGLVDIPDSLNNRTRLDLLVGEISKLERLEGRYIGYASQPSTQRDYSEELLKLADTNLLLQLTDHKNPVVRLLSFKALNTKAYSGIRTVLKKHIQDNETYKSFGGCLITPEPVNLSMYNLIKSQLTPKERLFFGKQIKEQLTANKYWALNLLGASI